MFTLERTLAAVRLPWKEQSRSRAKWGAPSWHARECPTASSLDRSIQEGAVLTAVGCFNGVEWSSGCPTCSSGWLEEQTRTPQEGRFPTLWSGSASALDLFPEVPVCPGLQQVLNWPASNRASSLRPFPGVTSWLWNPSHLG